MQKQRPRKRFPLLALLLLLISLAGCQKTGEVQPSTATPSGAVIGESAEQAAPTVDRAPARITVKTALRPAIDPTCLEDKGKFALVSAPMPDGGLEPGMVHVFCATGAPAGQVVTFTLKSPDGNEQSYQAATVDQGGVSVAVQPVTIGADAKPGKWTMTAAYGDEKDSVSFKVKAASQPFLALAEPVSDDPNIIRVAIGGLSPNALARFAIYRLQSGQTTANSAEATGELLIENMIQTDESGRADLVLNVADQPSSPYLLTLLPENDAETASAVINLPERERTALAVNIHRGNGAGAAAVAGAPPAGESAAGEAQQSVAYNPQNLPPAPTLAEAGGGLPDTTTVSLPDASLPPCTPTAAPMVQMQPQTGEVGQWWYGCASGFTPGKPLRVDATLGNGQTTSFDLTKTSDEGVKSFRWYSLPEEGNGVFSIRISDLTGNQADAKWMIASATTPHLLVYPHVVIKDVGAELHLTGFPPRAKVQMGIYQIDAAGTATLVKKLLVKTDKRGVAGRAFNEAADLTPGTYMLMAQSSPAYQFSGIGTAATAIEFFSVGAPLAEKYEFYTLFVGREAAAPAAPEGGETTASAGETSPPAETPAQPEVPAVSGIPTTLSIPVDNSAPPTCPDAQADAPAICMMPDVIERATYTYMLMHGFEPNTKFIVSVTTPKGGNVKLSVRANDEGVADAHWYALNNEKPGVYRVKIRGGGKKFNGAFKVIKATSPHLVVQARSPKPGTPIIASISGLKPQTTYALARYRSTGEANGQVQFQLVDVTDIPTGKGGGAQMKFDTRADDAGVLFMMALYEKGGSQPLAKEVYAPGRELYLRYPFAWGGE